MHSSYKHSHSGGFITICKGGATNAVTLQSSGDSVTVQLLRASFFSYRKAFCHFYSIFLSFLPLPKIPLHSTSWPLVFSPLTKPTFTATSPFLHLSVPFSPKSLIPSLSPQPVSAFPCSANPLFPVPVIGVL